MLKKFFIFIAVFGMIFIFSQSASATLSELVPATRPSAVPEGFASVKNVVTLIFNTIITISGVIFLIMLLIGGIQYLTGAGNEETTGKAKKMMIDAIVGLIIVLASWAIGTWILGRLGGVATTTSPASTPGSTSTTTPPPSSTPSSSPTTSPTAKKYIDDDTEITLGQFYSFDNANTYISFKYKCQATRSNFNAYTTGGSYCSANSDVCVCRENS